jgi:hypothetical protein
LHHLGFFGKSKCANTQEAQAWSKNHGLRLLGYAFHSIVYRFFIIKYEVYDLHVGTIMELNDATFLKTSFP